MNKDSQAKQVHSPGLGERERLWHHSSESLAQRQVEAFNGVGSQVCERGPAFAPVTGPVQLTRHDLLVRFPVHMLVNAEVRESHQRPILLRDALGHKPVPVPEFLTRLCASIANDHRQHLTALVS